MTSEEKKQRAEARREEHRRIVRQATMANERSQRPVKSMVITIEWVKSRTWGSNPHAVAEVKFHDGQYERSRVFKCSGCGYDKESTVVAEIFNAYLKYKLYQKSIEENLAKAPYGMTFGIGSDYRGYSGGIGMSCYYDIAKFIGGSMVHVANTKTVDVWKYQDTKEE